MRQAHRVMERPDQGMSIKEAAYLSFPNAYEEASGGKALSPSARQVFYVARPRILQLTGKDMLDSKYITQTLLPNFEAEHPELTQGWDVTYDARGSMIEPHTGIQVGLGTLEVREYLNDARRWGRRSPWSTTAGGTLSGQRTATGQCCLSRRKDSIARFSKRRFRSGSTLC